MIQMISKQKERKGKRKKEDAIKKKATKNKIEQEGVS